MRREPAVAYITPSITSGSDEKSLSGRGPRLLVFNFHASWSLEKLSRVIWSSGE